MVNHAGTANRKKDNLGAGHEKLQTRSRTSRKRMWTYRHCPNRFQPSSDGEEKSGMESCDSVQSAETESTLMSSPSVYTSAGSYSLT